MVILLYLIVSLVFLCPFFSKNAEGVEIGKVSVVIDKGIISVSGDLRLDDEQISDLRNGLPKEFIFYVDLFREWTVWPDEFISGKRIVRKIKSDPVKKEFSMISSNETSDTEQRFNSLASLLSEALTLEGVSLFFAGDLLPGRYFVKISAESKIRKLAPIIGYLLFFVPEKEFTVEKNSNIFVIPEK